MPSAATLPQQGPHNQCAPSSAQSRGSSSVSTANCLACSVGDSDSYTARSAESDGGARLHHSAFATIFVAVHGVDGYHYGMSRTPSIDEAIQRAKQVQDDRINAIRSLGEARQQLADIQSDTARQLAELQAQIAEQIKAAERDDLKAYNAALNAGWSTDELRKIGYSEPEKKRRTRRRSTRSSRASNTSAPSNTVEASTVDVTDTE